MNNVTLHNFFFFYDIDYTSAAKVNEHKKESSYSLCLDKCRENNTKSRSSHQAHTFFFNECIEEWKSGLDYVKRICIFSSDKNKKMKSETLTYITFLS